MPTYLSLFSGIGGLDLAVEAHGFTCAGQVEYEPACAAVLERHWPTVPRWGDVHGFSAAAYAEERGRRDAAGRWGTPPLAGDVRGVDLIIGGYPCQPFSHAGKRGGTDDPRHLWPEFARLVGEFRPRWVLLENVPGHLSLGAAEVLADLAALGYDATWTTVRASDVGAPHRRERWFCLAERTDADGERRGVVGAGPLAQRDRGQSQPGSERLGEGASDAGRERVEGSEPQRIRVGLNASGLNRSGFAWGQTGGKMKARDFRMQAAAMSSSLLESDASRPAGGCQAFAWGHYEPAIRRWEAVMGTAPHPVDDRNRLAPAFVEWMMGFPAGWTEGMTRTQALKALGNAVVPQQGTLALRLVAWYERLGGEK